MKKNRERSWVKWGTVAACFALILAWRIPQLIKSLPYSFPAPERMYKIRTTWETDQFTFCVVNAAFCADAPSQNSYTLRVEVDTGEKPMSGIFHWLNEIRAHSIRVVFAHGQEEATSYGLNTPRTQKGIGKNNIQVYGYYSMTVCKFLHILKNYFDSATQKKKGALKSPFFTAR